MTLKTDLLGSYSQYIRAACSLLTVNFMYFDQQMLLYFYEMFANTICNNKTA